MIGWPRLASTRSAPTPCSSSAKLDEAAELSAEAEQAGLAGGDREVTVQALVVRALVAELRGQAGVAVEVAGRAVAIAEADGIAKSAVSANAAQSLPGTETLGPAQGGGIYSAGTLTITGSTVSDNTAQGEGGGIYLLSQGCEFDGFTMAASTVSGNVAQVQGAGGGIYVSESQVVDSALPCSGYSSSVDLAPMLVVDSTIADNQAQDTIESGGLGYGVDVAGGGITMFNYGVPVDLVDSTVVGNAVTGAGDAGYVGGGGLVEVKAAGQTSSALWATGSIIADNTSDVTGTGNECGSVAPVDAGYNFFTGGSCGFGTSQSSSRDDAAISLGELGAKGGPSDGAVGEADALETAALEGLLATDEAVDALPAGAVATLPATYDGGLLEQSVSLCGTSSITSIDDLATVPLGTDERGVTRSGTACDAGAYEQAPTSVSVTSTTPSVPVLGTEGVVVAVTSKSSIAPPTGTVSVTASGSGSGSCTVTLVPASDGMGSCPLALVSAGEVTLELSYVDDEAASSGTDQLDVAQAVPTLIGLSPASGPVTGGTPVTVDGTDLGGATAVEFGTTPASSFACSTTQCVAVAPQSGAPGPVSVTVTDAGGASNALSFVYTAASSSQPPASNQPSSGPAPSSSACPNGETVCQTATS